MSADPEPGRGVPRSRVSEAHRGSPRFYQLESIPYPSERYTGFTDDLEKRISAHNNGQSPHTSKHKPWRLVNYFAFSEELTAKNFEAYLKTGSGRAFAHKRLW